jgi:hypothetical protein
LWLGPTNRRLAVETRWLNPQATESSDDSNATLSIPSALRTARPDDYHKNPATIDCPDGANCHRWSSTVGSFTPSSSKVAQIPPSPAISSASG